MLCPQIRVEKSPDETEGQAGANDVTAGGAATFTITVINGGDGQANAVNTFDDLPGSGWSVVGGALTTLTNCAVSDPTSGEHAAKGEILTCGPDTIGAGASKKVTVTKTTLNPTDCGEIDNTASVTVANAAGDSDSGNIDVLCPDLELLKTTSTPEINAGGQASYTVTITNDGDGAAINVDLSDALLGGVTWSESSDECEIDAGVLECSNLTIPAKGSFSVTLSGTASSAACPSILNRATFTSDNAGGGASAPEGQGTVITVNCPDLEVDKVWVDANGEPTDDPVTAGNTAYFAITVTNHGPGTATAVEILDDAPDGTTWTVVDDGGFDCPATIADGGDPCSAVEMAPGSATILLSFATEPEDCGSLTNTVKVTASNEPDRLYDIETNEDSATVIVECPGLNIAKLADTEGPIDAGEEASFHVLIWNAGEGDALNAEFGDDLPPGSWSFDLVNADQNDTCISGIETDGIQTIGCDFGTLEPSAMPVAPFGEGSPGKVIRIYRDTDREDCGSLDNLAWADASNDNRVGDDASILVKCPTIGLEKENDTAGSPVLPGTEVTYTLTLTVTDGPAEDVVVKDVMPVGLEAPADVSDGGEFDPATRTITWDDLGDLADGTYFLTYKATVADDVEHGEELINAAAATSPNSQCPDFETLGEECKDTSTVIPRVPTLVIDKVADVEEIAITGPANAPVATPSVVTWTLTYTLANGPVTNAVISDEVPAGLEYVDGSASGGGVFDEATNTITWTYPTLTESGSVTFQTSVDPETISRTEPTVNVAVIDSDETTPDDGEDSITVTVETPPQGGNPTPTPGLPDTATGLSPTGEPVNVPVEILAFVFIGSMGALTLANVRARNRRG